MEEVVEDLVEEEGVGEGDKYFYEDDCERLVHDVSSKLIKRLENPRRRTAERLDDRRRNDSLRVCQRGMRHALSA